MKKHTMALISGLFSVICAGSLASAADFSKKIPAGSSFGEVLGIWGDPVDKVEKTVKREVVWYYPDDAKVVFKDGKVRSYQSTRAVRTVESQTQAAKAALAASADTQLSGETRDLVRDIAKEVPSGPDVPGGDSGSAPVVVNPGQPPPLIPNQVPPGGRGAAPGIAPGEVMVDAEED